MNQNTERPVSSSSPAIFAARHWRNLGIELAPGRTGRTDNFRLTEEARISVRKFTEAVQEVRDSHIFL